MEPKAPEEVKGEQEYEILSNPRQREVLKRRVVDLVNQSMTKDNLIFLDRTARPLAYMYMKAFSKLHPDRKKPTVGFINIGTEKTNLIEYSQKKSAKAEVNYEEIFGKENIQELQKFLGKLPGQNRLLVDESEDSGDTKRFSMNFLNKIDSESTYDFFTFIDDNKDKRRFTYLDDDEFKKEKGSAYGMFYEPIIGPIYVPWGSIMTDMNLVKNREDYPAENQSFFTARNPNPTERQKGLQLRNEFDRLVDEIEAPATNQ